MWGARFFSVLFGFTLFILSQAVPYWMIYRGPSFLVVVWFGSTLAPFLPRLPSATCLSCSVFRKKVWPSINHSILYVLSYHHKVHIGLEYHYHSACPLFGIGTTPLPSASVPPPPEPKEGTHSPGGGVSQFGRLEKKPNTVYSVAITVSVARCRLLSLTLSYLCALRTELACPRWQKWERRSQIRRQLKNFGGGGLGVLSFRQINTCR